MISLASLHSPAAEVLLDGAQTQILVVASDTHQRQLLRFMLEEAGHHCLEAVEPEQALHCWRAHPAVDLIVIDVRAPDLEWLDLARRIRAEADSADRSGQLSPAIVCVVDSDQQSLERCLVAGADELLPRPLNERLLGWKIANQIRQRMQARDLACLQSRLQWHQHHVEREHRLVEHLYSNNLDAVGSRCENMVGHSSPLAMFNGDLLLSAPSPAGGVYVLLGHFSGRGLAVAVGALPAANVFFSLASQQVAVSEMAAELNRELYRVLPREMYCCATLLHLDRDGQRLSLWSGGAFDTLFMSPDGSTITAFSAGHLPLGVLPPNEFDDGLQLHDVAFGGHLYLCTDTLFETRGETGEVFGEPRYRDLLRAAAPRRVSQVVRSIQAFQGGGAQRDTFSLVEIHCAPLVHRRKITREILEFPGLGPPDHEASWEIRFEFSAPELRQPAPLTRLLASVRAIGTLTAQADKLHIIVSELFRFSLDHGLLGLDPAIKQAAAGLARHNQLRAERLAALEQASIVVTLAFTHGDPHCVTVTVSHNGPFSEAAPAVAQGAGLEPLQSLCSELSYRDGGRTATAQYRFRAHPR